MKMLNKIFEKPIGIIAIFYLIVFISLVGIGLFYISNSNALVQNTLPPKLADTLGFVKELDVLDPRISAAVDITKINNADQPMLDKGKQIYTTVCASCHGNEGKADGPAGIALNPKPRNFHDIEGWKNGKKFVDMFGTLQKGILTSGMPAYDYMPADERIAVISFVRTFMTDKPIDTPEEIKILDETYGLSAGTKQPGQVPLASASMLIVSESQMTAGKIDTVLSQLSDPANEMKFSEFTKVADNYRAALSSVLNSSIALNDVESFKTVLYSNIGKNGFSSSILRLNAAEFNSLFSLLKSMLA